MRQGFALFRQL
jgi:hypothetical protein